MGPIRSRFSSTVRIQILGAIPRAAELHAPSILARPQHCVPHIVASKTAKSDLVAFSLVKLSPHLVTHCVDSLIERPPVCRWKTLLVFNSTQCHACCRGSCTSILGRRSCRGNPQTS